MSTRDVRIFQNLGFPFVLCAKLIVCTLHGGSITYEYDSLNRVTNVAYLSGAVETYTYDPAGNRLSSKVIPPNRAPVAARDLVHYWPGQSTKIAMQQVLANDSDPESDGLTVSAVSITSAQNGALRIDGLWIVYTPPAGFVGIDSFNYSVSDGHGGEANGVVSLTPMIVQTVGSIKRLSSGVCVVRFKGTPNLTYSLQVSTNLLDWVFFTPSKADADGAYEIVDSQHLAIPLLFYRSSFP